MMPYQASSHTLKKPISPGNPIRAQGTFSRTKGRIGATPTFRLRTLRICYWNTTLPVERFVHAPIAVKVLLILR
jgi:hypothetical protein